MGGRWKVFVLGVATLGLVLTGCGSSHGQGTASGRTDRSSAGGAAITVGVVCSCSGTFGSDFISAEHVYEAWVNTVNAGGGIDGHHIALKLEDDGGTAGTSVTDATQLISDHVDAILDESIADQTWASAVQKAAIPVVGGNATEVPFYSNPDFYPEGTTNDAAFSALVATAKQAGATKVAFLYCAEAPSCASGVPLVKAAATKAGLADLLNDDISATAPNYTAQCVAAQQDHIDGLIIAAASVAEAQSLASDCNRQGYKPALMLQGEALGPNVNQSASFAEALWSPYDDAPLWSSSPEVQKMNTAIDKYYPGLRQSVLNYTQLAANAWDSGLLLQAAVDAGGLTATATPSAAEISTGLNSFKGETLDGTAPPLTFRAGQPHPVDCWFTAHWVNGQPQLLGGGRTACSSAS